MSINHIYSYGDIFGTLLHKNQHDTQRTYFVVECEYWVFYRKMFKHGWSVYSKKEVSQGKVEGYEVTLHKERLEGA